MSNFSSKIYAEREMTLFQNRKNKTWFFDEVWWFLIICRQIFMIFQSFLMTSQPASLSGKKMHHFELLFSSKIFKEREIILFQNRKNKIIFEPKIHRERIKKKISHEFLNENQWFLIFFRWKSMIFDDFSMIFDEN